MARKRSRRKKEPFTTAALFVFAFILGALFVVLVYRLTGILDVKHRVTAPEEERTVTTRGRGEEPPEPPRPFPLVKVAIVIDDMGYDMGKLRELLEVDAPITVAVLPHLKLSKEVALEAYANGTEVLLHLPMEPKDIMDNDPGKGALLTGMADEEVLRELIKDLDAVPYLSGVNNHMGSKFTEDEELMRIVLEVIKQRDFYFLDSKTSDRSVAVKVARELGVRTASRTVFLDNMRDEGYIRGQVSELLSIAEKRGKAIAIGHPYPETIAVLKEVVPAFENEGVELVRLSELVE
jgi:polysaccharide deacetylase 2 family uncharacterized protein YibQ